MEYRKVEYMVEKVDRPGVFLELVFKDAEIKFTSDLDRASRYTEHIANMVIKHLNQNRGFTEELKVTPVETIRIVGVQQDGATK